MARIHFSIAETAVVALIRLADVNAGTWMCKASTNFVTFCC